MNDQKTLNSLLRYDLLSFIQKSFQTVSPGGQYIHNWHIEAIAWHLTQCIHGSVKRLIITLPPRSLKSIACSVALPAWVLGNDPTRRIICASYAQDLAIKHALDCRSVMESDWYRQCFPYTRPNPVKNTQAEIQTTHKGYRLATSVGGSLTGRGGNLLIIDDPHKADEAQSDTRREAVIDWFLNTVISRLDNKKDDVIILIMQRLHEFDLAGHQLDASGWTHLNLPAIAEITRDIEVGNGRLYSWKAGDALQPKREPIEVLESLRASMGSYVFAAQYLQRPAPAGGGMIKWEWFRRYKSTPDRVMGDLVVQSWDTANKAGEDNDWSVCTTWLCRDRTMYLLDVFRRRLEFPALYHIVRKLAASWQAGLVIIENANAGTALIQQLQRDTSLILRWHTPKLDKATRMLAESPALEQGRVLIPGDAPWLDDFHREVVQFPKGRYDDQVDSLSQFLFWARTRGPSDMRYLPFSNRRGSGSTVTLVESRPSLTINDIFNLPVW